MKRIKKQDLLRGIEMVLRNKTVGEHHCHSFDESIYLHPKTYRKTVCKGTLTYFQSKTPHIVRHSLYEVFFSDTGIGISTPSYHLPVNELTKEELQHIYETMIRECRIEPDDHLEAAFLS